jgi:hypothetical protein
VQSAIPKTCPARPAVLSRHRLASAEASAKGNNILDSNQGSAELCTRRDRTAPWIERPFQLISWLEMNKFSAEHWLNIGSSLEWFGNQASQGYWNKDGITEMAGRMADRLAKNLSEIGCKVSSKAAQRFSGDLDVMPSDEVQSRIRELKDVIYSEMEDLFFLHVPPNFAILYNQPLAKWEKTCSSFQSAAFDIEEGSKSLALRRNTACVFHMMRVIGAGLNALGKSLNEPSLDASYNLTWDNVLSRCVKELAEKFSGKSPVWQADKEFYAKATATLLAVKDAWRNPSAHEVGFAHSWNSFPRSSKNESTGACGGFYVCCRSSIPLLAS